MLQPYRSPGAIVEPPARVEGLTLRRYPIWVQIFWLSLLPVATVIVGQLFPNMTLVCAERTDTSYCTLDEARLTGTRHYALVSMNAVWIREDRAEEMLADDDVHLLVTGHLEYAPGHTEYEPERFSFETSVGEARRIKSAHDRLVRVHAPLRRTGWLLGLFAAGELALVALFMLVQRRIRVEVNADTGDVTVEDRRAFRPLRHRSVNLRAVKTIELVSLAETGDGHARRVLAFTHPSAEPYELFEAFEAEARRGFQLLERTHASLAVAV